MVRTISRPSNPSLSSLKQSQSPEGASLQIRFVRFHYAAAAGLQLEKVSGLEK
jgi:hypothetical protein